MKTIFVCLVLSFVTLSHMDAQLQSGIGEKEITISGIIDGSDVFQFHPGKITWTHKHWGSPKDMRYDGEPWPNLERTPRKWLDLRNFDLSKARIIQRKGRDTIALETARDGFALFFCDSPLGGGSYSVTIAIPRKR